MACWWFLGIECLVLIVKDLAAPREGLVTGMLASFGTLVVISFLVLFFCAAYTPGVDQTRNSFLPLNQGFMDMLSIADSTASIFTLPAMYCSTHSLVYAYGLQIHAMSSSGMFAPWLSDLNDVGVPYLCFLAGSAPGLLICVLLYFTDIRWQQNVFLVAIACAFIVYINILYCFIVFRTKYANIERHFTSPLGIAYAIFSIVRFAFCLASSTILNYYHDFQDGSVPGLVVPVLIIVLLAIATTYYFLVTKTRQCFSAEESSMLFLVMVAKSE